LHASNAPTATIQANPNPISPGQTVTLTLTSSNGTSATLNGSSTFNGNPVPLNGTLTDTPLVNTTYTFAVTGPGGTTTAVANEGVQVGKTILNINAPGGIHYRRRD
jgi:hypothetical protein